MKKTMLLISSIIFLKIIGLSQPCPTDLFLSTQEDVDNFINQYPNCTTIEGSVVITGDQITNLYGLINITSIEQRLAVKNTSQLTNLEGLNNLEYIGFNLEIIENTGLTSLQGLESLETIDSYIQIESNDNLLTVNLPSLTSAADGILVEYNPDLVSIDGLGNLEGSLYKLMITDNPSLMSLEGLEKIESVIHEIHIAYNLSIESLSGLDNLETIGGEFLIVGNAALSGLEGLDSLETIGGWLLIAQNNVLESLSGIDSINPEELDGLDINNNPQLSECDILSICEFLAGSNENIMVYMNNAGCNSTSEIEYECFASTDKSLVKREINIFYNYYEHVLHVNCHQDEEIKKILIYNTLGQLVSEVRNTEKISFSHFRKGLYFAKITTSRTEYNYRFFL